MKFRIFTAFGYRNRTIGMLAAMVLLAGCARTAVKSPSALPALPPLNTAGAVHYAIQSDGSNVRFLVYRAGPLAAFGHNHVIRAAKLHGDVYLNSQFALSGFTLTLPVKDFVVDEPAARAREGADFAAQPSAAAISGTTSNMLGPALLDASRFPDITIRSAAVTGSPASSIATVRVTLHGVQRDIKVPIKIDIGESTLTAVGSLDIKQTDFGIAPFSILGGGLQVADLVKVEFSIVAIRD